MRRYVSIVILICFLLSGCQLNGERIKDPVTFYYVRNNYQESLSNAIASEIREGSGHTNDLSYLMALYLMGPVEESNLCPIPRGTRIYVVQNDPSGIILKLSESSRRMSDAQFSLASACLSLTCLELTDADVITVSSETRSVTMTSETILLFDSNIKETP
jgi:hypothetical protein